jgi:tripartite-type tricarboxylate transporter receptor subunit TctC
MQTISRRALLISAIGLALGQRALAQTTAKPVRIIVPFPAGGGTDVAARLIAEKLRGNYAPSVIVENRVGASGRTGVEAVKSAEPDGTTLLFTPDFLMTVYPHSFKKLAYDPLADFVPIALIARSGLALAAGPALPAEIRTIRQYVDWARANPKRSFYATTAAGGTPHFVGMMLANAAGVTITPVHYRGGAPALQDLLGGHVPASVNPVSESMGHARSGALRILAVTGAKRSPFVPEVPTMREQGFDVMAETWLGLFVPARTPAEIVTALATAVADAVKSDAVVESLAKAGNEPALQSPEAFAATVRADITRWGPIVKASGFVAED